jgi:hypothetical protein
VKISHQFVVPGRQDFPRLDVKPPHTPEAIHPKQSGAVEQVHIPARFHSPVVTQQPQTAPQFEALPHLEAAPYFEATPHFEAPRHFEVTSHFEGAEVPQASQTAEDGVAIEGALITERIPSPSPQLRVHDRGQEMILSVVPHYVHGEERVSVWRQPRTVLPQPQTEEPQTRPLVAYTTMSDHHAPETVEVTKPAWIGHALPPQEHVPSPVTPERSFSPPKMEWDASRCVSSSFCV